MEGKARGLDNCVVGQEHKHGRLVGNQMRAVLQMGAAGLCAENILDCDSYGGRRIPTSSKCQSSAHGGCRRF